MELNTYYICLLRKGPKWTSEETPELEELQARHMEHIGSLVASGAKVAAGPVDDVSDIRGFSIFRTATLAEAQALAEADPAVQAGRFIVELHAWRTPAGGVLPPPMAGGEAGSGHSS
ncbi:MAG TPA: YciI family protein [Ktedonobacterales bacterium]